MLHTLYPLEGDSDKTHRELVDLFHEGGFFFTLENKLQSPMLCSIRDIRDGDEIRIVYGRSVNDFRFGANDSVDRTFSILFTLDKMKEGQNV
jgi:hypothetical protein